MIGSEKPRLPSVMVANFHKSFTGVSSTIKNLVPVQCRQIDIGVVGENNLELSHCWSFWKLLVAGFKKPDRYSYRVWHARRAHEMLAGLFLRDVLKQRWRLVFTAASKRPPGRFQNFLINRMDGVIAASRFSASLLNWHNSIILHGINCDLFHPLGENETVNPLFDGKRSIGLVGRIREQRGSDIFVDAMLKVLPHHPDCIGVLVGTCRPQHQGFKTSLLTKIKDAGLQDRIIFLDEIDQAELTNFYREIEICAACSSHEGFGLTVLEAFASGTPVVATRAGAWPDIVDDEVGALIDLGDSDALATQINAMLLEPKRIKKMGYAARERAVERHDIKDEASAIVDIYKKLMSGESLPKIHTPHQVG